MTTREFSAIKLPHPSYLLDVGCLNLGAQKDKNVLSSLSKHGLPKYSDSIQIVEVKKSGADYNQVKNLDLLINSSGLVGSYLVLENVRPELFLRRDFITSFVNKGSIYLAQDSKLSLRSDKEVYRIYTLSNILHIVLNEKQYRRFGLVGEKIILQKATKTKHYEIAINLNNERIKTSNKYQDNLNQILARLDVIDRICFKYVPFSDKKEEQDEGIDQSLDYFKFVIDEYEKDGFKPVPITGCRKVNEKLERKWTNRAQLHPPLELNLESGKNISLHGDDLTRIVDIIDWLGYQLLSLDCNREEISSKYPMLEELSERYDVACIKLSGFFDHERIEASLEKVFNNNNNNKNDVILRALLVYDDRSSNMCMLDSHKCVILMQTNTTNAESSPIGSLRPNMNVSIIGLS